MKDRNAVNAEYEVLESQTQDTQNAEVSIKLDAKIGTISYDDIAKLPEFIRQFIKQLMPECESGVVPPNAVTKENLSQAKDIRAKLNALDKKLNDERIRIHNQWEQPYTDFVKQFNEKCGLLDGAINALGKQIKDIETAEKNSKAERVIAEIKKRATDYRVGFDKLLEEHPALWQRVWKDSYGNKSVADTKTQAEYTVALLSINEELKTIEKMPDSRSILQAYYRLGNLSQAITEAQQFNETQKREEEQKAIQTTAPQSTTPQAQPKTQSLQPEEGDIVKTFKVWHKSAKEFHELIGYMKAHGFHACIIPTNN